MLAQLVLDLMDRKALLCACELRSRVGSWMADPGHCLMKSCAKRVRSGPSFGIARRRYAGRVSRSAAGKSGYLMSRPAVRR